MLPRRSTRTLSNSERPSLVFGNHLVRNYFYRSRITPQNWYPNWSNNNLEMRKRKFYFGQKANLCNVFSLLPVAVFRLRIDFVRPNLFFGGLPAARVLQRVPRGAQREMQQHYSPRIMLLVT